MHCCVIVVGVVVGVGVVIVVVIAIVIIVAAAAAAVVDGGGRGGGVVALVGVCNLCLRPKELVDSMLSGTQVSSANGLSDNLGLGRPSIPSLPQGKE